MTTNDPPDPPVRLPVEDALATAGRRTRAAWAPLLFRLLPFLRREWWRDRIVDNPLLKREIRFHLRRPLASPGFWLVTILGVGLVLHLVSGVELFWDTIHAIYVEGARTRLAFSDAIPRPDPPPSPWLMRHMLSRYLNLVAPFFLGMALTLSWQQERITAAREELLLAPLTLRQLIGARVTVWFLLLLGFPLFAGLLLTALRTLALIAQAVHLSDHRWDVIPEMLIWVAPSVPLKILEVLALLGLGTRCALRGWPPVAVGLVLLLVAQVIVDQIAFIVVANDFRLYPLMGPVARLLPHLLLWLLDVLLPLIIIAVTWHGLAARIARDYPLAP